MLCPPDVSAEPSTRQFYKSNRCAETSPCFTPGGSDRVRPGVPSPCPLRRAGGGFSLDGRRWGSRARSFKTDWHAYAQPPFGGPEHVLAYSAGIAYSGQLSGERRIRATQCAATPIFQRDHPCSWTVRMLNQQVLAEVGAARPHQTELVSRDLCQSRSPRLFQESHGLLSSHTRKVVQEHVEAVAAFDVIEQRSYRHPCPDEYRIAAVDLRIRMNDRSQIRHR